VFFSRGFKLVRGMMDDLQAILVKHFYAKGHPRAAFTRYPGGNLGARGIYFLGRPIVPKLGYLESQVLSH
jgi:hypothetical protein